MKRITSISVALCLAVSCAKNTVAAVTQSFHSLQDTSQAAVIRVLCYNIHHANPPSRPEFIDVNAIANVIKNEQPDVVALQEVDVYTTRSGKSLHQAEEIGRLTGMKAYFAKAIDFAGGEYGVAILSKLPMGVVQNHPLPTAAGTGGERRTLATAVITLPSGKKILFACTHLDAQGSDTNRIMQAEKVVEILRRENMPIILAGDFNATPSTPTINIFDKYFKRSCVTDCGFTIPVINPTKTIDFIVYAPAERFGVIEQRVIPETYASDHRPVVAVLRL
ncbi:MAG TPA: endonuclease/exonuclease/phosphatase family protein [Flavitalea sp.]|nr:endonuclease/exonuclease/phosphatase family protein [Flavitalea sp.]